MAQDRRRAGERPLKRRVGTRRPKRTFLIFCEGQRTEPEYLNALKMQPFVRDVAAVDLRVETGHGGVVPRTLVALACDARSRAIAEDAEIDEFWCVFDVEWPRNHPGLAAAISQAERNGVRLAVSNPCFELWLILHFQDHGAWLNTAEACKLRQRLDGSTGKGVDATRYLPFVTAASARAAQLDERHEQVGTRFPRTNPSSGMHRLLAAINSAEP
jgi:hypothetical protein